MKIGFSNYVQELRIDCAKKLLSETNCKVKDVALRSGFGDYHYFSKTFKKFTGLSLRNTERNPDYHRKRCLVWELL